MAGKRFPLFLVILSFFETELLSREDISKLTCYVLNRFLFLINF